MENDTFTYKTFLTFGITSKEMSLDKITGELNIIPDNFFRIGETSISKYSGSIITKPHNLWGLKSRTSKTEEESISHHIEYLKSILLPKKEILVNYKNDSRFELSFSIWLETNDAGFGIDLSQDELFFINSVSNRLSISFTQNTQLRKEFL